MVQGSRPDQGLGFGRFGLLWILFAIGFALFRRWRLAITVFVVPLFLAWVISANGSGAY